MSRRKTLEIVARGKRRFIHGYEHALDDPRIPQP